jgi:alpha-beta hydrolase superfamily lysophospholipase
MCLASGLGESEGATSYTPHYNNLSDLRAAVAFLAKERGLAVHCVFGYSAGGNVAAMFAGAREGPSGGASAPPFVVCASPRFHMAGVEATLAAEEAADLAAKGEFTFAFSKRGQRTECVATRADLALFAAVDMQAHARAIPAGTCVLLVHGLADERVPPADSAGYCSAVANAQQLLLPGVGHEYAEEGAHEALFGAFKGWLLGSAEEGRARKQAAFAESESESSSRL